MNYQRRINKVSIIPHLVDFFFLFFFFLSFSIYNYIIQLGLPFLLPNFNFLLFPYIRTSKRCNPGHGQCCILNWHCTALHGRPLYCTALHCTALYCTALHCTALHCTALHCTTGNGTTLHCTKLHSTTLLYPLHS